MKPIKAGLMPAKNDPAMLAEQSDVARVGQQRGNIKRTRLISPHERINGRIVEDSIDPSSVKRPLDYARRQQLGRLKPSRHSPVVRSYLPL